MTPPLRIRPLNPHPVRPDGGFVLYWMVAFRRLEWNWALQRAAEEARRLNRPLVILEALSVDYPWASVRFHRFVLDGMADHRARLRGSAVRYLPFIESRAGEGRGLVEALAESSALVVTDDAPVFFLPRMQEAVASRIPVRMEAVDSNGLLPLAATDRTFTTAYSFRRFLHKTLPDHLLELPSASPLADPLPETWSPASSDALQAIEARWPRGATGQLIDDPERLSTLPIDQAVAAFPGMGGRPGAVAAAHRFLNHGLAAYPDDRNHPDREGASRLSPWLHWGQFSVHELFSAVVEREEWTPLRLSSITDGRRSGWWGMSPPAEAFLDQLVTWREIGFNMAWTRPTDYDRYESLPVWALTTLEEHAQDPRPYLYSLEEFDGARTHDPLWNAAQRQLRQEGIIHNYLRMLWGKKILEWSASPREALAVMIELNNRYALDGRDPNSYSGIFWTLGRYDRGWPERAVFGKVRSMTSASTLRKVDAKQYLQRFGDSPQPSLEL